MKYALLYLSILFNISHSVYAQSIASHDGIELKVSSLNTSTFYYGEPLYFFFNVTNAKETTNFHYMLQQNINCRVILKDLNTNKISESLSGWGDSGHIRSILQQKPPSKDEAFAPKASFVVQTYLNPNFGSERLATPVYKNYNRLDERLRAVPVGKYELTLRYYLYPSEAILTVSYLFEVKQIPAAYKPAFDQYVKTTVYAFESHYDGTGDYSESHPDSYDNFLRKYPDSPYSDCAFVDQVTQIYFFPGPTDKETAQKCKEYLSYFPKRPSLKIAYIVGVPMAAKYIPSAETRTLLDKFLKEILINEDPTISQSLVRAAETFTSISNLTNYAKEKRRY